MTSLQCWALGTILGIIIGLIQSFLIERKYD